MADVAQLRTHLARQVDHWTDAAARLGRLDDLAGAEAWGRLEQYLGVAVRAHLREVVQRLARRADMLRTALAAATTARDLAMTRRDLAVLRRDYLRAETTLDFYADAINTRTNPVQGALLRAFDTLAQRSMAAILEPLGYETPIALTYIDKGLGASILKAGLRLWDGGTTSAAAAIKIARHNLGRPTALVHEAGHQVAHITGWNDELAGVLAASLSASPAIARMWSGWASEISADAVAFVHTGYASVLALHDVLAGDTASVFQVIPGDPHPMSYLRVELGAALCRCAWGAGPWDGLVESWRDAYPLSSAGGDERNVIAASAQALQVVAECLLTARLRAFRGRSLVDLLPPERVSPRSLAQLEQRLGPALFTSSHWIWTECLRLLAISALRASDPANPASQRRFVSEGWMLQLGGLLQAA
jgi:hypothetical protein